MFLKLARPLVNGENEYFFLGSFLSANDAGEIPSKIANKTAATIFIEAPT